MKNLTREQFQMKMHFAQLLSEAGEDIHEAVNRFNEHLNTAAAEIETLQGRYNELVQEAQGFMEGVRDEQESYSSERSDRWREGDAGQAYEEWVTAWGVDLEEIEVPLSDEIEDTPLDAVEALRDLPDRP